MTMFSCVNFKDTMTYLSPDFLSFFKELAANNNRDWFDANRTRYEQVVREPFKVLVADLISALKPHIIGLDVAPKDCIFRINRDIRFSKDKTPYKLHASAAIAKGGRKDMVNPGLYIQLDPEHTRIFSGIYKPNKQQLYAIRSYILNNTEEFEQLIQASNFKGHFGEIQGDKNKILPKEFKEAANRQPLLFNKAFFYGSLLNPEMCLDSTIIDVLVNHYIAAKPLNQFFNRALAETQE